MKDTTTDLAQQAYSKANSILTRLNDAGFGLHDLVNLAEALRSTGALRRGSTVEREIRRCLETADDLIGEAFEYIEQIGRRMDRILLESQQSA